MSLTRKQRIARILSTMEQDTRAGGRRLDRAVVFLNRGVSPKEHARRAQDGAAGRTRRIAVRDAPPVQPPHVARWWDDEDEITRPIPRATTRH